MGSHKQIHLVDLTAFSYCQAHLLVSSGLPIRGLHGESIEKFRGIC